MDKNQLKEDLLHEPLKFEGYGGVDRLIGAGITFDEVRELVRRIYDLSEPQLRETSNANSGTTGKLNRRSTEKRTKQYYKKVFRQKPGETYYRIYAEGDSWFQFPVFITDIIDWLKKNRKFLVYSEAYGGDWITNIIYEGQYIPSISVHAPGYFLISGGGNDLVGGNRLALMVEKDAGYPKYSSTGEIDSPMLSEAQKKAVVGVQQYIRKEFYAFLNVVRLQYTMIFRQLYKPTSKHRHIVTITQGYDYPFPSPGKNWSLRYPLQPLVNQILGSGKWLYRPLMIKGILDKDIQQAILMTFIFEFNETMSSFAKSPEFPQVFHIDCRGVAPLKKQWYDELHLKGRYYREIARAYEDVILNHQQYTDRVIVVNRPPSGADY